MIPINEPYEVTNDELATRFKYKANPRNINNFVVCWKVTSLVFLVNKMINACYYTIEGSYKEWSTNLISRCRKSLHWKIAARKSE